MFSVCDFDTMHNAGCMYGYHNPLSLVHVSIWCIFIRTDPCWSNLRYGSYKYALPDETTDEGGQICLTRKGGEGKRGLINEV